MLRGACGTWARTTGGWASSSDVMNRGELTLKAGGGIGAALFAFAFVAAPKSCEWGLAAYFWLGVAALVALFALPMVLQTDRTALQRAAFGVGFAAFGAAVWIAGLFIANV